MPQRVQAPQDRPGGVVASEGAVAGATDNTRAYIEARWSKEGKLARGAKRQDHQWSDREPGPGDREVRQTREGRNGYAEPTWSVPFHRSLYRRRVYQTASRCRWHI